MELINGTPAIWARDRQQWRQWLAENHLTTPRIWLIIVHKHSRMPGIRYEEAVEEALCFGWIDSTARSRDKESGYQYFTRRKPGSTWSQSNRDRVERMMREGKMAPAGMEMVENARRKGLWDRESNENK